MIPAAEVARLAPYREIVEALREGFRAEIVTPVRHHHEINPGMTYLLMPAWSKEFTGLKTVVFKPGNPAQGLPTITASYLLIDNATGATVAMLDGTELTRRRTAAASALASDYLSRPDSSHLVMVGAGALASHFVRAHAAIRPINRISIFARSESRAEALAEQLRSEGFPALAMKDVQAVIREADIVSSVTTSTAPVVKGAWLKPGTHVDLAGAFTPRMRETDGDVVAKAQVYVDTRDGALAEAGDLLQARDEGKFDFAKVRGDLFELCRGKVNGREDAAEITLFKSCGTAIEDLATAIMVYQKAV